MARRDRYGAARKKKKNALLAPLTFLLVCVALVFGMGVFFRVQTIEVQGIVSYTPEEVIEASGIDEGQPVLYQPGQRRQPYLLPSVHGGDGRCGARTAQ